MTEHPCPICKKPVRASGPSFPFCSRRCRLIDLGAWVDERYRITRPLKEADLDPEGLSEVPPSREPSEEPSKEGEAR